MAMPWRIEYFPFGAAGETRAHVVPLAGNPRIATAEEVAVWEHVHSQQAKIIELETKIGDMVIEHAKSGRLPPNPHVADMPKPKPKPQGAAK